MQNAWPLCHDRSVGLILSPMPSNDKNRNGSFVWVELATSDQPAAKNFYTSLFAWTVNDMPMGPGEFYSIFQLQGRDSAAAYTLRPEQRSQGVPPNWLLYVGVESADAATQRIPQLGGSVLMPAFDVGDMGRMAVLQDPTGAVFAVWQAKTGPGLGAAGENNALCWADLSTPDPDSAAKFYQELFGWKIQKEQHDESGYFHIKNGEDFIGGVPPAKHRRPGTPAHWLIYFQVASCDESAAKARMLGANFHLEPMTMENVGRMAVVADPQGAVFALFQPMRRQ
jgi:predicted enzyme related to lactoylglutathione lyase